MLLMPGLMHGDVRKHVLDFDQSTRLNTERREHVTREECLTGYDRSPGCMKSEAKVISLSSEVWTTLPNVQRQ